MAALIHFKAGGVGQYFEGQNFEGKVTEVYASTCSHCGSLTEFPSQRTMMDHVEICRGCMKLICLRCHGGPCRPFEAEAERQEREARLRERLERQGWRCY